MSENVILVSQNGKAIGTCEKLKAHLEGRLHRAFSLMIVRKSENGFEFLLQKRANDKYHSGDKWSNSCCSHPRPGENLVTAVNRRVTEELGIQQKLRLVELPSVVYRAELDNGLTEYEYDHVFVCFDEIELIQPNPEEVSEVSWISIEALTDQIELAPGRFTAWFTKIFVEVVDHLDSHERCVDKLAS